MRPYISGLLVAAIAVLACVPFLVHSPIPAPGPSAAQATTQLDERARRSTRAPIRQALPSAEPAGDATAAPAALYAALIPAPNEPAATLRLVLVPVSDEWLTVTSRPFLMCHAWALNKNRPHAPTTRGDFGLVVGGQCQKPPASYCLYESGQLSGCGGPRFQPRVLPPNGHLMLEEQVVLDSPAGHDREVLFEIVALVDCVTHDGKRLTIRRSFYFLDPTQPISPWGEPMSESDTPVWPAKPTDLFRQAEAALATRPDNARVRAATTGNR